MKMTKGKFHPELKSVPLFAKVLTKLCQSKGGMKFLNWVGKFGEGKIAKGLDNEKLLIKSNRGDADIRLRIYRPKNNAEKLPVLLYLHGGGYAMGNPETYIIFMEKFIETRPCVIVAPAYRRSMTKPYPAAFNDCYDTLLWIRDNADSINGDPSKIMVGGHSAGGGLTAAVTLRARDTKDVNIAFQMPVFPMIDDRQQTRSSQFENPIWGKASNNLGWELYLKDLIQENKEIPSYAAPARNTDYTNFPPSISYVGGIDPFRDETITYFEHLEKANIPVKFKVFEGCYHAFELVAPKAQITKDAINFLYDSYAEFYDKYI